LDSTRKGQQAVVVLKDFEIGCRAQAFIYGHCALFCSVIPEMTLNGKAK
jgi:hypothetical protein